MRILDYGMTFDAVIVFVLGLEFLSKWIWTYCDIANTSQSVFEIPEKLLYYFIASCFLFIDIQIRSHKKFVNIHTKIINNSRILSYYVVFPVSYWCENRSENLKF